MRLAALGLLAVLSTSAPAQAIEHSAFVLDAAGQVTAIAQASASLERNPPGTVQAGDSDALRFVVASTAPTLAVALESYDGAGNKLDLISRLELVGHDCPKAVQGTCRATPPIRAVADFVDREHPLVRGRSIVAELGGTLVLRNGSTELGRVRVTGPRQVQFGGIARWRGRLRFVLVKLAPGGALPVGGDRDGAAVVVRSALARANALWGACGISFGPSEELTIDIVDPPPAHLVALGCVHGLSASGGAIELKLQGKTVRVATEAGMLPRQVARRLGLVLEKAGFVVAISDNPRVAAGAHPTADVLVRDKRGRMVELAPPASGVVSTDPTLGACIGSVNLEDGLQHFGDVDAHVGTLEERTLIKAFDDFDPATIEVFMVPGFARGGRIGESFIASDRGSISNAVVLDRAGVRSNRASFTLAHELGHVLLDDPGHPDDFAADTPTLLMDADASDPTAFGPRRLTMAECVRAVRQSGAAAPSPLLAPWPLSQP